MNILVISSLHLLLLYIIYDLFMFQVSIMQIASDKMVFIIDLLKLYEDVPDVLDNCLTRILQSSGILKLGMRDIYILFFRENLFLYMLVLERISFVSLYLLL